MGGDKMITKPNLSRYRKCPGCGTWQVNICPCPKCGTSTYIEPDEEKKVIIPRKQKIQEAIAQDNMIYVQRALDIMTVGDWYPKSEVLRAVGAYSKSAKRLKVIWEELEKHVDVRTISPRPHFGPYIWISKRKDEDGKN